ncbi:unnamed protein product [Meganyctiphanes norvegica]|uniref:SOCS box domain-containing protein n=1 Tax=Meganyctiphanes norvegica TaxID=48144 RepID=A0AAV2RI13_MEGNR
MLQAEYFEGSPEHGLVVAAFTGNLQLVQRLLPLVSDINGEATPGFQHGTPASALWWASGNGQAHIVTELLKHEDIDIDKKRMSDGSTALMCACRWGQVKVAQILLVHGANILLRKNSGRTALVFALGRHTIDNYLNRIVLSPVNWRHKLVMALLMHYPQSQLESAIKETQKRRPGLLTSEDILLLRQAPALQELCKKSIVLYTRKKSIESLPLPKRLKSYLLTVE